MIIECEAKGNPHPIFSWRRNGKYFNVARDSQVSMRRRSGTLDIYARNNPEQYEAEYQCIASNQYGSAYTHKIRLRLYRPPVWPREILEPVVISAGLPLVLPCDPPPGPPKPETYWMSSCSYARPFNWPIQTAFPTMQAVRQDRRVSMGVNGDLYFSNVLVNDSTADYCCNARFPYKNVIQQKMPVVVKVLTIRTVAEAAPTWLSPKGSSSSILVLHGEELLLECIAAGVVIEMHLYIFPSDATPRIIGTRNELVKTIEGHHAFLDCRFFGSPMPELRWSKYGQGNLEGNRFKTHSNGTLEIKRIRIEDQGTYLCVISNIAGRDENQVRVDVKEPIIIVTRPQSMKVMRGSDVRLECGVKADITTPVTTTWMKNKKQVALSWRVSLDVSNLVITNVNRGDEGNYTCVIQNEMEQKSASAHLMVMDRPNPPTDLELSDPYERSVRLSWVPGDSNHSPINAVNFCFLTEYLVQYDDDDWIPGKWKNLSTYPGNLNSIILHLSPFTYYEFRVIAINEIGSTPDVIPKNVKGVGTWRNNMEISWEPLTWREWNGPHLKYLVWWRRKDSREEWKNATTKWLKYYIYDADTFTPYDIKVQAVNDFGLGPESPVVTGYSGEDRPIAAPLNLRVSDIESTQVTVHWDPVTRETIMGELKEYKVYYWRDSSQLRWHRVNRGMKSQVFPNNDPEPSGIVTGLIPYSNYRMYIVVTNSRIQQRHLDSIYVDWDVPEEPNGVITGYSLKYQTVNTTRGEELKVEEFPPNVTSFSIRRYDRYTRYRFSVAAQTRIGQGEWHTEESPHYTTEIYAQDQVDISTQGWFIGIMCAVALIVLILLIVCFIKRSRGGKYPVRDKKDISLELVDDKDQEGSFDYRSLERITRVSTLPYPRREEERGLQRAQSSVEAIMKRSDSDDSLVEYGEGGEIQFNEDGSFIGQYTGTRRDVRDLDFGGNLELHSPMNTIYSLA
ncbi:hypothetical protein XENORESO_020563 [Xenotaenia resolanae]|uniref:Neurofascin n=1 Tax=Xenotaenia resolanae TaxID=208358 RepID=A0ABV0VMM4_9TELE